MEVVRIKKTTSTNDYVMKYLKRGRDVAVVADCQSAGRGTKGRSFSSEKGGIYLSMLRFCDLPASDAFGIISDVSVAVVKTLLAFGLKPWIKWPNDILVDGKKICGILTENKIEGNRIVYSVAGLGLNVNNPIPDELKNVAVSMREIKGEQNFEAVLATLLLNLSMKEDSRPVYDKYSLAVGRTVTVTAGDKTFSALVKSVLPDGRLLLSDGTALSSAEISIRI